MNTKNSDKIKNCYALYDWGNKKQNLPTGLIFDKDQDKILDTDQVGEKVEKFEKVDGEGSFKKKKKRKYSQ